MSCTESLPTYEGLKSMIMVAEASSQCQACGALLRSSLPMPTARRGATSSRPSNSRLVSRTTTPSATSVSLAQSSASLSPPYPVYHGTDKDRVCADCRTSPARACRSAFSQTRPISTVRSRLTWSTCPLTTSRSASSVSPSPTFPRADNLTSQAEQE